MIHKKPLIFTCLSLFTTATLNAATLTTTIISTETNAPMGQVVFEDSLNGLLIKPQLTGLPQGLHGFHIHQVADCSNKGMGAGGHWDPNKTNSHQGPYGLGHMGDLPILAVNAKGEANIPVLAPRLKTKDIAGHALMIHEGGDNYTDTPPLGGGGARIGCGAIPK